MRIIIALFLAGALLAGCGAEEPDRLVPPTEPKAELHITVWPQGPGNGDPLEYSLLCAPPAGTHPDPPAGCAALEAAGSDAFKPTPADMGCTMIYGGPQVAELTGTLEGRVLEARLVRSDGCAIARWDALKTVVSIPAWNPAP